MQQIQPNEAFRRMSPLPYVVVTSLDKNGKPNMIGVGWVTRTSWEPFLLLVSIDRRRYSHEGIHLHKQFVVNYLPYSLKDAAWLAGTKSGRDTDKIALSGLKLSKSSAVEVPSIEGATAAFECELVSEHDTGDHTAFVGKVVAASTAPENDSTLFCTATFTLVGLDAQGKLSA